MTSRVFSIGAIFRNGYMPTVFLTRIPESAFIAIVVLPLWELCENKKVITIDNLAFDGATVRLANTAVGTNRPDFHSLYKIVKQLRGKVDFLGKFERGMEKPTKEGVNALWRNTIDTFVNSFAAPKFEGGTYYYLMCFIQRWLLTFVCETTKSDEYLRARLEKNVDNTCSALPANIKIILDHISAYIYIAPGVSSWAETVFPYVKSAVIEDCASVFQHNVSEYADFYASNYYVIGLDAQTIDVERQIEFIVAYKKMLKTKTDATDEYIDAIALLAWYLRSNAEMTRRLLRVLVLNRPLRTVVSAEEIGRIEPSARRAMIALLLRNKLFDERRSFMTSEFQATYGRIMEKSRQVGRETWVEWHFKWSAEEVIWTHKSFRDKLGFEIEGELLTELNARWDV
jgi:hypothetical protein